MGVVLFGIKNALQRHAGPPTLGLLVYIKYPTRPNTLLESTGVSSNLSGKNHKHQIQGESSHKMLDSISTAKVARNSTSPPLQWLLKNNSLFPAGEYFEHTGEQNREPTNSERAQCRILRPFLTQVYNIIYNIYNIYNSIPPPLLKH